MADVSGSEVVLKGPSNWERWISTIQKYAKSNGVWDQINPSLERRAPCLQLPKEPQITEINQDYGSIMDLNSNELKIYEFMYNQYRTVLQSYKEQQKSLAQIQQYIIKTVGNYYSTIEDEHDVAEELLLLKRRVQPSDWVQKKETLTEYKSILNSPDRTDLSSWVTNWQKVLTNAKRINLPEAEGLRPTQSFLESIHQIDSSFSDYWTNKLEDKARSNDLGWENEFPDGIEISEIFERTQATKANVSSQSTSFAIFKEQNSSDLGSKKTPNLSGSKKPLCPCGWNHYFAECFYINKNARPANFKPSTERLQKVETFLTDPINRKKVENALEKAQMFKLKQSSKLLGKNSSLGSENVQASAAVTTALFSKPHLITSEYPLKNSFILDSGSDGHICNDFSRFSNYHSKISKAVAGSGESEILGYGTVFMRISTGLFQLNDVAYIPSFHTSLASLIRLQVAGISWNPQTGCIFTSEKTVCYTERKFNQYVIEYNELKAPSISTFSAENVPQEKTSTLFDIKIWHERLGHPSDKVLQKVLFNQNKDSRLLPKRIPECESCKLAKATRIVKRIHPSSKANRPFYRIFADLFSLPGSYNNKKVALLVKDDFTKLIFFYPLPNSTSSEIIRCFESLQNYVKCQFSLQICVIHRDNDVSLQKEYQNFITQHGIEDEPTAPYTPAQNGSAERSGGVISTKARTMRLSSSLPEFLWPEIWKTAVFLHNRIPHQGSKSNELWKSPMEKLYKWLQENQRNPPLMSTDLSFLRAYGCKAYPLTVKALKNKEKIDLKLEAHAEVGYLVGYDSSNIFRIYIPSRKEVRRVRDVTFNEEYFFTNENSSDCKKTPEYTFPPQIPEELDFCDAITNIYQESEIIEKKSERYIDHHTDKLPEGYLPTPETTPTPTTSNSQQPEVSLSLSSRMQASPNIAFTDTQQLRTPRPSRSTRFFGKYSALASLKNDFPIGAFHAAFQISLQNNKKFHRKDLPPPPQFWSDLASHPLGNDFINAGKLEWNLLHERKTFYPSPIPRDQATLKPLPLTWSFSYKFNKHGYLRKVKSRLCVRGDLQPYSDKDTYAATLAARNFRILTAIIAKFDLDARSLDAINAFTNADLDEIVYVYYPEGFKLPGFVLQLSKALYGLRRSPLLWQKDLSTTFESLGLEQSTEEPCIFFSSIFLVFFYVDDIIVIFQKQHRKKTESFILQLKLKYDLTDRGNLSHFLGIRITRDRAERKLWITQDSYIEKIANSFNLANDTTNFDCPFPLPPPETFEKNQNQASKEEIQYFQSLVGSTNYAAVSTRPDISKYSNCLAEHMQNPTADQISLAERLISYLYSSRFLSIVYSDTPSKPEFLISSDAAFADDPETRFSSQGFVIHLFGGPIVWSATRQKTVTTSSTEAELLAFTFTAKELISTMRLFSSISLQLNEKVPEIQCDNQQTIRLITSEIPKIRTALKHVNIHDCWSRQEYVKGSFKIKYTPTSQIAADGLTKLLPRQKFLHFRQLLDLKDVKSRLVKETDSDSEQ